MWRIIIADWRRHLGVLLGGWGMALTLLLVIAHSFSKECCLHEPERSLFVLKISLIAIAYSQSAAVLWAQLAGHNIYYRQRLLATLPLSQLELNLVHYLTGALFMAAGIPFLAMTLYLWHHYGLTVEPWLAVFTMLGVIAFIFLSMRNLFPRVVIPILFVVVIIPGAERLIRVPLEVITTPVPSVVMAIATALLGWWAARRPTPDWAPGWGGRARAKNWLRRIIH